MSGILPLFMSAPRCFIKVNETKIAWAIGLSFQVTLDITPVKVLGAFGIQSLEPTAYNPISGTFRIFRLMPQYQKTGATPSPAINTTVLNSGLVGVTATTPGSVAATSSIASSDASFTVQKTLDMHIDPTQVLLSQSFDIDVELVQPSVTLDKDGKAVATSDSVSFLTLKDCRIISRDVEIAPGRLIEEPLSFQGLLVVNTGLADESLWQQTDSAVKQS